MSKVSVFFDKLGSVGKLINQIFAGLIKPSAIQSGVDSLSVADFAALYAACKARAARDPLYEK